MIDIRLRSQIGADELAEKIGKILTPLDYNVLLTGPTFVRKPDGTPLAVYLPGAIPDDLREQTWPILQELRELKTFNRGLASGSQRVRTSSGSATEGKRVSSGIIGSFEGKTMRGGRSAYCRLTAWTGRETEKFRILNPLLRYIGEQLEQHVPDRWAAQMAEIARTSPDWVIEGTPFTTVTVNNTYETGVHQDKGDLDAGFSTLAVFRRGEFEGGHLVFPEYRVGVNMQDGDLILMDAHAWHGNTFLNPRPEYTMNGTRLDKDEKGEPIYERISVVSYFRSKMVECGDALSESEKARVLADQKNAALVGE